MVDVMLVLLIIFMVITPMLVHPLPVRLPTTNNPQLMPDADKSDAVVVAVNHDGHLFLGTEMISSDTLTERIRERLGNRSQRTVFVRADARVRYKFVVDVVDEIRASGVDQLGLLTEQAARGKMI